MYQTGGAVQGSILQEIAKLPQDQQKQIMTAFGKWAQSKGLNLQQLQGNEQVLEQALTQFLQEMQGARKARLGAKLNYIRSLKNNAPEGMDVEYYKCGGQVKKKFVKKNACGSKGMAAVKAFKDKCGSKMKKKSCKEFGGEIQSDKCGSKMKKSKKEFGGEILFDKCGSKMKKKACGAKFELGGEVTKKPKKQEVKKVQLKRLDPKTTKNLPGGKYPSYWTSQERQTWERLHGPNDEGAAVAKEKCGGKAKKHLFGGILEFQQGGSFKDAWNTARKNKVRYFNWNGRMYNSKDKGNDVEYNSFRDNMNEMSAQLSTDKSPGHLGWKRSNPTSNELRGNDRIIGRQGTESVLPEYTVIGTRRQPTKKQPQYKVYYNMPNGAIEYIGRDGKSYWMRQDHSNGQYYYIDRSKPISWAKTVVPEGYIIPGANIKINKGTNIGKIGLGLEKKWL